MEYNIHGVLLALKSIINIRVLVLLLSFSGPLSSLFGREGSFHQWRRRLSDIKYYFKRGVVQTAPVRNTASLIIIFFRNGAAAEDILQSSEYRSSQPGHTVCLCRWIMNLEGFGGEGLFIFWLFHQVSDLCH